MTEHLAVRPAMGAHQTVRFKSVLYRSEERRGSRDIELLSLSSAGHLYPRTKESDRQQASEQNVARCLVVNPGDLVVNPMWLTGGSIAVSDRRGAVSPEYRVFRPSPLVWPRYVHHVMRMPAYMDQYRLYTRADTTFDRRVQQEDLDDLPLPLPPVDQQRRIADFLDDQVARIDNIIAGRLVQAELLDAALDAALEAVWLPSNGGVRRHVLDVPREQDVPSSWSIRPLGSFLSKITYGFTNPMPTAEDGPYMLSASDIGNGVINYADARRTEVGAFRTFITNKSRPEAHDVLLTKDGTLGRVAEADGTPCCITQSIALLRPSANYTDGSIVEVLQVRAYRDALLFNAGGTAIKHLYISRVATQKIAIPPSEIRAAVIDESKRLRAEYRSIRAALADSIILLTELKQSLVTAAVIGAFDLSTTDGSRVSV